MNGFNHGLARVIDYVMCRKNGKRPSAVGIVKNAKIAMFMAPENKYIRYLVNCVMYEHKKYKGLFEYEDFEDGFDPKIFAIFSQRSREEKSC